MFSLKETWQGCAGLILYLQRLRTLGRPLRWSLWQFIQQRMRGSWPACELIFFVGESIYIGLFTWVCWGLDGVLYLVFIFFWGGLYIIASFNRVLWWFYWVVYGFLVFFSWPLMTFSRLLLAASLQGGFLRLFGRWLFFGRNGASMRQGFGWF